MEKTHYLAGGPALRADAAAERENASIWKVGSVSGLSEALDSGAQAAYFEPGPSPFEALLNEHGQKLAACVGWFFGGLSGRSTSEAGHVRTELMNLIPQMLQRAGVADAEKEELTPVVEYLINDLVSILRVFSNRRIIEINTHFTTKREKPLWHRDVYQWTHEAPFDTAVIRTHVGPSTMYQSRGRKVIPGRGAITAHKNGKGDQGAYHSAPTVKGGDRRFYIIIALGAPQTT